ncbi:hypothetical protein [Mesotoga prima]|uniref:hypothetical protein n=1 Tax=Mesotoga prima TaxID=1184387 RepID=UPI002BED5A95|nr:hypothetical protein [Mesotoga prima]HPA00341.1 hypothetical protein [Mesotoga prima]
MLIVFVVIASVGLSVDIHQIEPLIDSYSELTSRGYEMEDGSLATVTAIPFDAVPGLDLPIKDVVGLLFFELPEGATRVSFLNVAVTGKCKRGEPVEGVWADLFIIGEEYIFQTERYNPYIAIDSEGLLIAFCVYLDTSIYYSVTLEGRIMDVQWEFNVGK